MRRVLFLSLIALGACAPAAEEAEEKRAPASPFGFELASAQGGIAAPAPSVVDLAPSGIEALLAQGAVRLIDVRTDAEVVEGMIPGAEHIALDEFDPASIDLSADETVVFYCRSGRRSALAAKRLAAASGGSVAHLAGGIVAWEQADGELILPE
ncbi:MAG: rhodanese-like domain-containing protein [Erythrobacter sp.]|uniref:rhodanese-like domain-containing protein n=1 Tax=Erythrobacter sp. TaxID=1042 RepID=UPI0032EE38FC